MIIYIDLGNTTAKFATKINNKFKIISQISSKNLIVGKYLVAEITEGLKKYNLTLDAVKIVCLCSVRPMWDELINEFAEFCHAQFFQIKKNLDLKDFNLNLYNPKTIGADLLITAYAMRWLYEDTNSLAINLGTATTISAVIQNEFIGAIIMPGLAISANSLFNSAQLLQAFDYNFETKVIGSNTKEAINLGLVNSHFFAIKTHCDRIVNYFKNNKKWYKFILGGNSEKILPLCKEDKTFINKWDLTFSGMELALMHNNLI